jgi:hypothetical protein
METTLLLVILKETPVGICEIPRSEWLPVYRLVTKEFDGSFKLHDHAAGGEFHDFPDIPGAHYVAEIRVAEDKEAQLLAALKPLLNRIVLRNTHIAVSADR